MTEIIKSLEKNGCMVKNNVSGSNLSTLRCGGDVENLIIPSDKESLIKSIKLLKENDLSYKIIGNGSNTLISDDGYEHFLIKLNRLNNLNIEDSIIYVEGGVSLPYLVKQASEASLSGIEWAQGIPGTVGGAITMNAGCYGKSMSDIVLYADVLMDGKYYRLFADELKFSYRDSIIRNNDVIVLGVCLMLTEHSYYDIIKEMERYRHKRRTEQPQESSLGSVFKKIDKKSAAYYIDRLGLKGASVGGCEVSCVHSGFIINKGGARSRDYLLLATYLQKEMLKNYNLCFKMEVEYIGKSDPLVSKLKGE